MNAPLLLLLATTIVLRSGDRIAVDEPLRTDKGMVIFRSGGQLYSMPAAEIDEEATRAAEAAEQRKEDPVRRLRVSDEERRRLLAELEKNHSGTALPTPISLLPTEPPPTRAEVLEQTREEWEWRRLARGHEEAVRQAQEEVALLEEEADRLRGEIRSFLSQGFKPEQFTWQTTRLAYAIERLPRAELDLRRTERAYAQFRDDARRQGILPGWLR